MADTDGSSTGAYQWWTALLSFQTLLATIWSQWQWVQNSIMGFLIIKRSIVAIALKHTVFELAALDEKTDTRITELLMPLM